MHWRKTATSKKVRCFIDLRNSVFIMIKRRNLSAEIATFFATIPLCKELLRRGAKTLRFAVRRHYYTLSMWHQQLRCVSTTVLMRNVMTYGCDLTLLTPLTLCELLFTLWCRFIVDVFIEPYQLCISVVISLHTIQWYNTIIQYNNCMHRACLPDTDTN